MPTWESKITLGNVITLGAVILAAALWYAKVDTHAADQNIHASMVQREEEFDRRFAVRMEATYNRVDRLENTVDDLRTSLAAQTKTLNRIEGGVRNIRGAHQ